MTRCPSCGAAVEGGFCNQCGATLGEASDTVPDGTPALLRRPDGEHDALAYVVARPIAAGTQLVVAADETFVALAGGSVLAVLGPGRHALPRALDAGVLVKTAPISLRLGCALAPIAGRALRAMGTIELRVVDPATLLGAVSDLRVIQGEAFHHAITTSAAQLVERAVHAALERGAALDELDAALPAVLSEANALWPVPGTQIDISAVDVSLAPEGEAGTDGERAGDAAEDGEDGEDGADGQDEQTEADDEPTEANLSDLIGHEVAVVTPDGRRVRGTVQALGYLVELESGESSWAPIDAIELIE
jgi:hypothetical protein